MRRAHYLLALVAGCAPISPPPPFHLTETADVAPRGSVVITPGAGGGALGGGGSVGAGVRVRVGVGARQEVGAEAIGLYAGNGTHHPGDAPWVGSSGAFGFKLSYKLSPVSFFGFVVGPGITYSATGWAVGGDVAAIFSRRRGVVRPYGGVVGAFGIPVGRSFDDPGGVTGGFAIPLGIALEVARTARLFFEGGFLAAWADNHPVEGTYGGYGAIGVAFRIEGVPSVNR